MSRIENEFSKLRKRYKLKTQIGFSKKLCTQQEAQGLYYSEEDIVILKNRKFSKTQLLTVLHEICHAIQHRENRLRMPRNFTRRKYANELEAEIFSYVEYIKLYENKMGLHSYRWKLAHYETYRLGWLSSKYKIHPNYPMSIEELNNFITKLDNNTASPLKKKISEFKKLV